MADESNGGPQFKTPTPSGRMPKGEKNAEYMAYHLDPSGGINHSDSFQSMDHAINWLTKGSHEGGGHIADKTGSNQVYGYEIHRRHRQTYDGQPTQWTSVGGGHISVGPRAAGAKPHEREVMFNHLGHSFNAHTFQKKSAESWAARLNSGQHG